MLHWIWVLIVGAIIGAIAGALTKNGGSMGWISNILAGLIGSSIGEALLGAWGVPAVGMSSSFTGSLALRISKESSPSTGTSTSASVSYVYCRLLSQSLPAAKAAPLTSRSTAFVLQASFFSRQTTSFNVIVTLSCILPSVIVKVPVSFPLKLPLPVRVNVGSFFSSISAVVRALLFL